MNTIVALPFDSELASFIGKKGSEGGIAFYNRKIGDDVIVALMPEPEKFYTLLQVFTIAEQILISTKSVDKNLGEAIVASSLAGKKVLFTNDNDISKILSGLSIDYEIVDRASVIEKIIQNGKNKKVENEGQTRVDIDRAFNVKGIGTVLLGIVTKGKVKAHDSLYHSSGKQVQIRSIQSQDEDIEEAETGVRVGLAVKGMEYDEFDKGDILSNKPIAPTKSISVKVTKSPLVSETIEKGKRYEIGSNFSYSKATVESVNGDIITLALERAISLEQGDICLMSRDSTPRTFAKAIVVQ
ncbi:MAG: EF-Tu/IF-2/RF-3 family GTPase [Candidatus Micrarchaeia archaeon]